MSVRRHDYVLTATYVQLPTLVEDARARQAGRQAGRRRLVDKK